jgi:predicted nucleotidyltransferase
LEKRREYAVKIARATRDMVQDVQVYVIGGVAENRVTIYSDIDILVALPTRTLDDNSVKKLRVEILTRAMDNYNLPWDVLVEIHIADAKTVEKYMKTCRKLIPIKEQENTDVS